MSIEELGRIADKARDVVYQDWGFYLHLKDYGTKPTSPLGRMSYELCELVEECYGPRPADWEPEK